MPKSTVLEKVREEGRDSVGREEGEDRGTLYWLEAHEIIFLFTSMF